MEINHRSFGSLHYQVMRGHGYWLGATVRGDELCVLGDFFDDRPDPDCEALAVRELSDLDGLLARIDAFLATAREPYLDQWASRRWEVSSLIFSKDEEGRPTFIAEYLLDRDDYTTWLIRVEEGTPVALARR